MKGAGALRLTSFAVLLLLGPILGCAQVVNSPCANLNATIDIKPRADLALGFGNDAIKAAIDAVMGGLSQGRNLSVANLTDTGKEAAVRKAKGNGKNPSADDIAELERYLSRDVVPAIKQNPACNFTVTSTGKAYIGIDDVVLNEIGGKEVPSILVKNLGQVEADCHVTTKLFFSGNTVTANNDLRLGPGQSRRISYEMVKLPLDEIHSGKSMLGVVVSLSYPPETKGPTFTSDEAWVYEHVSKRFILAPRQ